MEFLPADIIALAQGHGDELPRAKLMAILTSTTCGEPCWHAREEVCRCSCGGRNHGCLANGGARPQRTAKIDGHRYKLSAVGLSETLTPLAQEMNGRQLRAVERPSFVIDGVDSDYSTTPPRKFTREEWLSARADSSPGRCFVSQYHYRWTATDTGAPARIKTSTAQQLAGWAELSGWKSERPGSVLLLWEIETWPAKPQIALVDKQTGLPLSS